MRRAVLTAPAQLGVASVLLLFACLALAAVSVLALVAAGAIWAAGYDVAGACGGG